MVSGSGSGELGCRFWGLRFGFRDPTAEDASLKNPHGDAHSQCFL